MIPSYNYSLPGYSNITYHYTTAVDLTDFLNKLYMTQLEFIDEAVEKSDLKHANELISFIKKSI